MAELLIKAVNATHPDPEKDARGCYKRGDVVGVAPNGWEWGILQVLPPIDGGEFVIIRISDVSRQQVINWIRNHWNCPVDSDDFEQGKRRRVRIDIDLVPAGVLSQLNQTGFYSNTWANIREYIRNKFTNETAVGSPID